MVTNELYIPYPSVYLTDFPLKYIVWEKPDIMTRISFYIFVSAYLWIVGINYILPSAGNYFYLFHLLRLLLQISNNVDDKFLI